MHMISPALERFISQAAARSRDKADPADCVLALAPLMLDLIDQDIVTRAIEAAASGGLVLVFQDAQVAIALQARVADLARRGNSGEPKDIAAPCVMELAVRDAGLRRELIRPR